MPTERVTVTLPAQVVEDIDRFVGVLELVQVIEPFGRPAEPSESQADPER